MYQWTKNIIALQRERERAWERDVYYVDCMWVFMLYDIVPAIEAAKLHVSMYVYIVYLKATLNVIHLKNSILARTV